MGALLAGLGFKFNVTIEKLDPPADPPKPPGVPGFSGIDPIVVGCMTVLIGGNPPPYVPGAPAPDQPPAVVVDNVGIRNKTQALTTQSGETGCGAIYPDQVRVVNAMESASNEHEESPLITSAAFADTLERLMASGRLFAAFDGAEAEVVAEKARELGPRSAVCLYRPQDDDEELAHVAPYLFHVDGALYPWLRVMCVRAWPTSISNRSSGNWRHS